MSGGSGDRKDGLRQTGCPTAGSRSQRPCVRRMTTPSVGSAERIRATLRPTGPAAPPGVWVPGSTNTDAPRLFNVDVHLFRPVVQNGRPTNHKQPRMKHTPHHTQKQNIAEAAKALGHILDRPVSLRPAPFIGERTSPASCPSSTPDRARATVPVSNGGERPAGPCAQTKCLHWSHGCTLGSSVAAVGRAVRKLSGATGQACALARQCRWFSENGSDACVMCPHLRRDEISNLVTELMEAAR